MQTVGYKQNLTGTIFGHPLLDSQTGLPFDGQDELVLRGEAETTLAGLIGEREGWRLKAEKYEAVLRECADAIGEDAYAAPIDGMFITPDFYALPDLINGLNKRRTVWGAIKYFFTGQ